MTGVINTWADLLVKIWQYTELTEMVGPYKSKPLVTKTVPLDDVVATARAAVPEMTPYFIAMPGSLLDQHVALRRVHARGDAADIAALKAGADRC